MNYFLDKHVGSRLLKAGIALHYALKERRNNRAARQQKQRDFIYGLLTVNGVRLDKYILMAWNVGAERRNIRRELNKRIPGETDEEYRKGYEERMVNVAILENDYKQNKAALYDMTTKLFRRKARK